MKLPFLFCIIGVILTASSSVRNLPMQAHGFNELDYIGQLLVKGNLVISCYYLTLLPRYRLI